MQLRLGFERDASVARPKGVAVIDLDLSAANGQIESGNVLDVGSRCAPCRPGR